MTLAGFDLWLTHNRADDEAPEPSASHLADARAELPAGASDDEVYALAAMLAAEEARESATWAAEAEADSRNDDRDQEGDGPW
jgi:hypothetical protein